MGLFPGMRSNVSGLMFQPVKCLITHRAFVRSGEILPSIVGDPIQQRGNPAHSRHHIRILVVLIAGGAVVMVEVVLVLMAVVAVKRVLAVVVVLDVRRERGIGLIGNVQGEWRSLHVTRRLQGFDNGSGNANSG